MNSSAAETLQARYCARGLTCELEAGPVGIVVYAASQALAGRIADDILGSVKLRDPKAWREHVVFEKDEPAETSFVTAVHVDWEKF